MKQNGLSLNMFTKSDTHNPNYLASIVKIDNIRQHSNADRLQCTNVFFNNVITGMNAKIGDLVVYFPIESQISEDFLSYTNSFEDKELNADKSVKGYFSSKRRVRCMGLRNEKSQGYIVPVAELEKFVKDVLNETIVIDESFVGTDFDTIFEHKLVQKYVVRQPGVNVRKEKSKGNTKRYETKLVEGQFAFHIDTVHLKKFIADIHPNDCIVIQNKMHGTSAICGNVLVKKKLGLFSKLLKKIGFDIVDKEYGMLYSSRSVIKNADFLSYSSGGHFYDADVWKMFADQVYSALKPGITAFAEIVGYTPTGAFIQKGYDYGCEVGKQDFYIYRMNYRSPMGDVYEFSHDQIEEYCKQFGLKTPETYYHGIAKDMFPDIEVTEHWHENVLNRLIEIYLEKDCHLCKSEKIPAEGVVVKVNGKSSWKCYKLKSTKFLEKETKELDAGVIDLESTQSETTEELTEQVE